MHILLTARPTLLGSGLRVCLGLAVSGCLELRGAFRWYNTWGVRAFARLACTKDLCFFSGDVYYLAFFTFAVLLFGEGGICGF